MMGVPDDFDSVLKAPMHSIEAEQAVLGGLIVDPNRFADVADLITEQDFYRNGHQKVFWHIQNLADANQVIDILTVCEVMNASGDLEDVGGAQYLAEMAKNTPSTANIVAYAKVVRDRAIERKLLAAATEIGDTAYSDMTTEEKVLHCQAAVMALEASEGEETAQANAAIRAVIEEIDKRFNSDGTLTGLPTGLSALDFRTNGLQGSDLVIIAGRPAMGKTTLAMNIAEHLVLREKKPVLVFSMEMSQKQLMERMVSSTSGIPFSFIRSGKLRDEHWPQLTSGISRLKDSPLYIDDRAALTVNQMRSTARKLHKKVGLELIVVDYLQLATAKAEGRTQEVTKISQGLKAIAKELDIPVIAISQLSRDCEKRVNKRPVCADLRDSGSIEQDADIIAFVYRDEVYYPDSQHKGITEVIFSKFRNGEVGTDYLASRLDICRFDNLGRDVPEITEEPRRKFKAAG